MDFEHIKQRGPSDCGVAATAMFAGRSYEETLAAAHRCGKNVFSWKAGMTDPARLLEEMGFHWENLGRHKDHPAPNPDGIQFRSLGLAWTNRVIDPRYHAKFFWGRRALLSVHSLNNFPDGRHLVYCDGVRIFDPQEGRRGKKFLVKLEEANISEAWIWKES
jgi:hypothetical protein